MTITDNSLLIPSNNPLDLEVVVLPKGDLALLRATAAAYLQADGDDGVLEDVETATLERLAGKTLAELRG